MGPEVLNESTLKAVVMTNAAVLILNSEIAVEATNAHGNMAKTVANVLGLPALLPAVIKRRNLKGRSHIPRERCAFTSNAATAGLKINAMTCIPLTPLPVPAMGLGKIRKLRKRNRDPGAPPGVPVEALALDLQSNLNHRPAPNRKLRVVGDPEPERALELRL